MPRLQQVAEKLHEQGVFTGGPPQDFEAAGRLQLAILVREGLYPSSKLLDIGCGCLRAGYWLTHFLNPHCYFGIEPNADMLQRGIDDVLEPWLRQTKQPAFDTNDRFDFSVFGEEFDAVLARSIWTHSSKSQIRIMLDNFVQQTTPDAFFLTSYLPAGWLKNRDYKDDRWVGRSHVSQQPGLVRHDRKWIQSECLSRGLFFNELDDGIFNGQLWLKITKKPELLKDTAFRLSARFLPFTRTSQMNNR